MTLNRLLSCALTLGLAFLGGCATKPAYDYTAFQKAEPSSVLVLPPVNESPDVKATPGVWATATRPLAEAGYYVLPVTLVDQTLRQNGIQNPDDAQNIPYPKLYSLFKADAALYIRIKEYGTSHKVVSSDRVVDVGARLLDLRSGDLLWEGEARASFDGSRQSQGLIGGLITQIVNAVDDSAFKVAATANDRLLSAQRVNGLLPGPRSPQKGQEPITEAESLKRTLLGIFP